MRFREHYTELVEHFFRMAVRHIEVTEKPPLDWFKFTRNWIDRQSEEDKKFIQFVFAYQFRDTNTGLYGFRCADAMPEKRIRLAGPEKQFAMDSGLTAVCGDKPGIPPGKIKGGNQNGKQNHFHL